MALPSGNKQRIEGLGPSERKVAIVKPEHIKRGILILLGVSALLVVAAVYRGIVNNRSYEQRLDQRRADKAAKEDAAADKAQAANSTTSDPAASFQQDMATFQKNGTTAPATVTTATDPATGKTVTTGPSAVSEKLQEAMNEERIRAYKDVHEPLALAVPNGDKPVGTTTSASVRVVSQPEQQQPAPTGAENDADAQTQALLAQRARLVEQLRLLQSQNQNGGRQ